MTYQARPLTVQSGAWLRGVDLNYLCVIDHESLEAEDVRVYSHRRKARVEPSTWLLIALTVATTDFQAAKVSAMRTWAIGRQGDSERVEELHHDQREGFGDMFIAAHRGTP